MNSNLEQYINNSYKHKHQDWHLGDAPFKAQDIMPGLLAAIKASNKNSIRIADIGAGAGGVLIEVIKLLNQAKASIEIEAIGFEVSPQAVEISRQQFPQLQMRQKFFEISDGPFDIILFVDVLEHVENPWEMLRLARKSSDFITVRQPLLENFSTFRHRNYEGQRNEWGHIGFFNYYSFLDMTNACGWKPLEITLAAQWELAANINRSGSILHRALVNTNRIITSYLISGFYLNGTFENA
ncbi:MAG: methyltransferase domain-containing protein [Chloroflexota bacterium]